MKNLKVVGILQNQWFNDPDGVRKMLARHDNDLEMKSRVRRRLLVYALFAGCKTGRVLNDCFGEPWTDAIFWDEASTQIGGKSSSAFPPDVDHIKSILESQKPDVILCFGAIAAQGVTRAMGDVPTARTFYLPHPTARNNGVYGQLCDAKDELDRMERLKA